MHSATRILLIFFASASLYALMITISCFMQQLMFEKIHTVKLKNKLRTTVTKELKINISTLALAVMLPIIRHYTNHQITYLL